MSLRWKSLVCGIGMAAVVLAGCRKSETTTASASPAASDTKQNPPFGFIDSPKENEIVAAGTWSFGWALDDSGVASVSVSLDDGPSANTTTGQSFPGVKDAYPTFPNSDKAGFGFLIPSAAAGPHVLTVTIMANDGGKTELKRHIQIR